MKPRTSSLWLRIELTILATLALGFAAGARAVTFEVTAPTEYESGGPIPSGAAFQWKLYGAKCGQPLQLLTTFTSLTFERNPTGLGAHCYSLTVAILSPTTGEPGEESERSPEFKITVVQAPVAKKTTAPGVKCIAECESVAMP